MSNYSYPTFTKHYRPPFTWLTSEWKDYKPGDWTMVSIEFAEAAGWSRGADLHLGPYHLVIFNWDVLGKTLYCYRASGPREEAVRNFFWKLQHLLTSPFQYYWRRLTQNAR